MLNKVILVGRIKEFKELDKNTAIVTISVPRSFKNEEGVYETDNIDCTLYNSIAANTMEYCKKGDVIGIKGRVQNLNDTAQLQLIAEKVTFLSSRKEEKEGE